MKIGLVGWAAATGNGQMNRDLFDLLPIDRWLIPRHPRLDVDPAVVPSHAEGRYQILDPVPTQAVIASFLDGLDWLIFIEQPWIPEVVRWANHYGVKTCCIPMMEWLPLPTQDNSWIRNVDAMYGVTEWTVGELQKYAKCYGDFAWRNNIIGGCWGVDLSKWQYKQRERCDRFLFVNGQGGYRKRKGIDIVSLAWDRLSIPLTIRSQVPVDVPFDSRHVRVLGPTPTKYEVYSEGDVLVVPSRWEGLCHQIYEAMACGMPVMVSDISPMTEPVMRMKAYDQPKSPWFIKGVHYSVSLCGRTVPAITPGSMALRENAESLYGRDISTSSAEFRRVIEKHYNLHTTMTTFRHELERLSA